MKALGIGSLGIVLLLTGGAMAGVSDYDLAMDGRSSFTGSLTGSGTASITGTVRIRYRDKWAWGSWSSWKTAATGNINEGNIPLGLNPDTVSISATPTGTGNVEFERLFTTLDDADMNALDVDMMGSSTKTFGFDPFGVDISIPYNIIGIGGNLTVGLDATADGYLSDLDISADDATLVTDSGSGAFPHKTYGITATNSTATASFGAGVDATLDLGSIAGISLPDIDLGEILSVDETDLFITDELPFGGVMDLEELVGSYPKDVDWHMGLDLSALTIPLSFSESGSYVDATDTVGFDAGLYAAQAYVDFSLNYSVNATLTVSDLSYDLYDQIDDVVPEPATFAVFGLGGALLTLVRRRRR